MKRQKFLARIRNSGNDSNENTLITNYTKFKLISLFTERFMGFAIIPPV